MAIRKSQGQTKQTFQQIGPVLLAPHDQNADPAPLIATLARVALAIAQRRMAQHKGSTASDNAA
jgi:hypothetical protein